MSLTAYIQVRRWAEVLHHLTVATFISDLEGEIACCLFSCSRTRLADGHPIGAMRSPLRRLVYHVSVQSAIQDCICIVVAWVVGQVKL